MNFKINNRKIGPEHPVYIIAEMSANHHQNFEEAIRIIDAAKWAGADAVKLQTYTPDTLTIRCNNNHFQIKNTIWKNKTLYDLYAEAFTPWEWQPKLKKHADRIGIDLFSTPFDITALNFLEKMDVPAYKIASFEIVDIQLLQATAHTGKPIIMSTGMATFDEIDEAVRTIQKSGCNQWGLLKCTSAYPAYPENMNLKTIPHMAKKFNAPVGLSDHTLGHTVAISAVTLGACIVEKHFTLSKKYPGPDTSFSMEPEEYKTMVTAIRTAEKAIGQVRYEATEEENASRIFRRSLFTVKDIKKGEKFSDQNVRSIRPGCGLHTRYLPQILKSFASKDLKKGTPLAWECIEKNK